MISICVFSEKLIPGLVGQKVRVEAVPRIGEKIELGESRVKVLDVRHLIHDYFGTDRPLGNNYLGSVYVIRVFTE